MITIERLVVPITARRITVPGDAEIKSCQFQNGSATELVFWYETHNTPIPEVQLPVEVVPDGGNVNQDLTHVASLQTSAAEAIHIYIG